MLSPEAIAQIEELQARQGKIRKVAFNVLNKYNTKNLLSISRLASRVINGEKLASQEIQKIVDIAKEIDHPIPQHKQQFVLVTLKTVLVYRHFNIFGQELK